MKKIFLIDVSNKTRDRQVDSIKNEIRKYIKREKSKKLPENFNTWFFDCKFGKNEKEAKEINFSEIIKCIDLANSENYDSFYLEIIAKAILKEKIISVEENTQE